MQYSTRPLSDRTWLRPASKRERSRFDAKWGSTLELLGREVDLLGGRDVVIEIDVREQDFKLNGELRANARTPEHPAVVVAFETSKHGSMLYRCDRFYAPYYGQIDWQHNVRAIALTLQALRAVDRYGATETGQQDAVWLLDEYCDRDWSANDPEDLAHVHRRARAAAHPDRHGGDRTLWDQVEQAAEVLGVAR